MVIQINYPKRINFPSIFVMVYFTHKTGISQFMSYSIISQFIDVFNYNNHTTDQTMRSDNCMRRNVYKHKKNLLIYKTWI